MMKLRRINKGDSQKDMNNRLKSFQRALNTYIESNNEATAYVDSMDGGMLAKQFQNNFSDRLMETLGSARSEIADQTVKPKRGRPLGKTSK